MISITNNAASIQLNGDQNVTIVKQDVTKVQSVGINVLVVRRTNGIERKTLIPFTSVNVPQSFSTAQALADYISSILGSFDMASYIENSNKSYVAQVITNPFPIPDTDIKNSDGSYINSIPSADPTPFVIPDVTIENSDGSYQNTFPSAKTSALPNIDVLVNSVIEGQVSSVIDVEIELEDSAGNPITPVSVLQSGNIFTIEVTCTGLTVDFSVDDTTPETNQIIAFTDLTIGAVYWLWTITFDDGDWDDFSNVANPVFQLPYPGNYTVNLTAIDGSGNVGIETKSAYINCSLQPLPSTNLQAHYDAMLGASPSNVTLVAGACSQWNDNISGYDVIQGTTTSRPIYEFPAITAPNGAQYGAIKGDGSNDFIQNTNVLFTRGVNTTVYLVFKMPAIVITSSSQIMQNGTTDSVAGVLIIANNNQYRLQNGSLIDSFMMFPQGGWAAVKFQFSNSGNAEIQINEFKKAIANTGANTGEGITLFSNRVGLLPINISIAKAIVYSENPSSTDNDKVFQHIKAQLGVGQCL